MGGPIIFGAAVLIIFLLTGSFSQAGEPAPGKDEGPFPPVPPPGPHPSVGPGPVGPSGPNAPRIGPNAPGPNDGPAIIPGTKTPVSEVEPRGNADLEDKRKLISVAFRNAIAGRRKKFPKESEQAAINATAAYFKKRQVHIDALNVNAIPTYYKQPKEKMAAHLAEVVNTYIRGLQAPMAKPPGPSVTTKPDTKKVDLVRKAYSDAIVYLIDSAKQRKGSTITPQQAVIPVSQYFSGFGIPAPDALAHASQFWARSLADISSRTSKALAYTKQQVDIQTGVTPNTTTRISDLRA